MTRNVAYLLKGGTALSAALLVILLAAFVARPIAVADDEKLDALNMTALELQQEIEGKQAAYAAARQEADDAARAMDETRERIADLEKQIPEQQERSARAVREQYKFQQQSAGIVDLLLSADSFYDFLSYMEYMGRVSDANSAEINRLDQLKEEVVAEQENLKKTQRDAEAKAEDARAAMEAAQVAQAEVQRRIEEEARLQAEIAAQAEALAKEPRDNDSASVGSGSGDSGKSGDSGDSASSDDSGKADDPGQSDGSGASGDSSNSGDSDGGTSTGNDTEDSWAARIDAYLAGSPLAGQGRTFARAALKYGVDPRFSPAISFTESSKGLYCFKPHNAWGWGSSSWSSWEEAIDAHVAGLARGYGGQISIEGAKKYCPPNWKAWYNRTLAQMNLI